MNAPSILATVLGALLVLAVAYIVHLRHLLVVPAAAKPITYGRRAGDRLVDSVSHDVHFGDVYALDGLADPRFDHGTDITDVLFTGKAA